MKNLFESLLPVAAAMLVSCFPAAAQLGIRFDVGMPVAQSASYGTLNMSEAYGLGA
ncbi:MAG: hypothetical protein NC308_10820 [Clostridium sp.]|nr:hypothetical protein [Bacteroides sp.]MCM1199367.1 hypothetical protein [Clostridium sp.]